MGTPAGLLNRRITVLRRSPVPAAANGVWGGYAADQALWAGFRPRGTTMITIGGLQFTVSIGTVTVRDSAYARSISTAEQLVVDGTTYEVTSQETGEKPDGMLRLNVVAAPTPALYAREADTRGTVVTLRRMVPNGTPIDAQARAVITGYRPDELSGGIDVGQRRVIVLAEDLVKNGFPVPPTKYDKILTLAQSRQMSILSVDDWTHRAADVLNAYEIQASG